MSSIPWTGRRHGNLHGERLYRLESATFIFVALLWPLLVSQPAPLERPAILTMRDSRLLMGATVGLWLITLVPLQTLPFFSDDYVFLAAYRRWSDVMSVTHFFRPMFAACFLLLSKIGGGSAVPFHLAALLIHGASASLVYILTRRLFIARTPRRCVSSSSF